ncbi:MAG TPA: hypothetical protein VJT50_07555 [Pyrinomonadaceae bacterium]|nr:hypothetical protein [Pyrinomonadaceae bacterium]
MNGSCHAFLNSPAAKIHIHQEAPRDPPEQLCGLSRLKINISRIPFIETVTVDADSGMNRARSHGTANNSSNEAGKSAVALEKPCLPDCGSWASGVVRSNRQRPEAALAYAHRPRGPLPARPGNIEYGPTQRTNLLARPGVPRGPPTASA